MWRQKLDELAQLFRHDIPRHPDVPVQRQRLVLGGDENAPKSRVYAVAEREIDDAVGPAEVHGRLGPFSRQGMQAFPRAPREEDY
jgi:hypothetical protein